MLFHYVGGTYTNVPSVKCGQICPPKKNVKICAKNPGHIVTLFLWDLLRENTTKVVSQTDSNTEDDSVCRMLRKKQKTHVTVTTE